MKNTAKITMLAIGFTCLQSVAQIKPYAGKQTVPNPEYREFYITEAGQQVTPNEAFSRAAAGEPVYSCKRQEVSMNKTGKGASLKNVKKNQ